MVRRLRLRQVAGSIVAVLPKVMTDPSGLKAGQRVLAVEAERGILLTVFDQVTERALAIAAKAAHKYRKVLRRLAK